MGLSHIPQSIENGRSQPRDIQQAADYGNGEKFVALWKERQMLFETFVGYLQAQGLTLEFFPAPLSQEVLDKNPVFKTVEIHVNSYASDHRIRVRDSYDCRRYGLSIADFYDRMHPKKYVSDLIMQ